MNAALTDLLASKGLPNEVSCMLAADFGQLPSAYKFKVANAHLNIGEVRISGADHMLPELLGKSLAPLKSAPYLRSDVMKVLEKNLVPLYQQHRYLKFAIAGIKPELKVKAKNLVTLEVMVNEGGQYKLGSYSWSGNTLTGSEELSRHITLQAGEPADALQLDQDLAQVKRLFGKFGRESVMVHRLRRPCQ